MEITKKKDGIVISGKTASVIFATNSDYSGDKHEIVIGSEKAKSGFCITEPGEFEVKGISVISQSSGGDRVVDIVEIIVEDTSVVIIKEGFKYSKRIHDSLGQVSVLIALCEQSKSYADILKKLDPEVFIPVGSNDVLAQVVKESEINKSEETSKVKLKADSFGQEGFILETYLLS
ncbi:hypothetical protein KC717_02340 [Candidatus Dojkabacteria bacterium]|uniref:Uncharacterized protein n=1 Tax=Candidatus Dojkabacteria bacterium TaxID=2099670 RepID=A0A955RK66_9BACT|nr:hypothetical protein [Candidatus Dojkabacteria bacterium]